MMVPLSFCSLLTLWFTVMLAFDLLARLLKLLLSLSTVWAAGELIRASVDRGMFTPLGDGVRVNAVALG